MSNLNIFRLDSDDPRLTAFALGELEGDELAGVAAAVAGDPSLQTAVDDIRATAGQLAEALKTEPLPAPVRAVHLEPYHTVRPARMFPFPYWAVAGLAAAACFVVLVGLRQLPLANQELPQKAAQVAKNTGEATKQAKSGIVGQQQASNHVEIEFPTTGGDGPSTSGSPGDDWGVVVPNAPQTTADASTAASAVPGGGPVVADKSVAAAAMPPAPSQDRPPGTAEVAGAGLGHPFVVPGQNPVSSFPLAAGNSGYADVRRFLLNGHRPPQAVVRLEELVNFFAYDYAAPKPEENEPIAAALEVASAPWEPHHRLVRIALKARESATGEHAAVVARNVAIEVEFNPAQVQSYRLLGYENPGPGQEKRNSDAVDFVSGRTVTAFYEVVPIAENREAETGGRMGESGERRAETGKGKEGPVASQEIVSPVSGIHNPVSKGLLTVRLSYQAVDGVSSRQIEFPLADTGAAFADASSEFRFAAAVAEFGLVLRDSPYKSGATLADVLHWAEPAAGPDLGGDRREFISLVKRAVTLLPSQG
jgi:hypothetical protein